MSTRKRSSNDSADGQKKRSASREMGDDDDDDDDDDEGGGNPNAAAGYDSSTIGPVTKRPTLSSKKSCASTSANDSKASSNHEAFSSNSNAKSSTPTKEEILAKARKRAQIRRNKKKEYHDGMQREVLVLSRNNAFLRQQNDAMVALLQRAKVLVMEKELREAEESREKQAMLKALGISSSQTAETSPTAMQFQVPGNQFKAGALLSQGFLGQPNPDNDTATIISQNDLLRRMIAGDLVENRSQAGRNNIAGRIQNPISGAANKLFLGGLENSDANFAGASGSNHDPNFPVLSIPGNQNERALEPSAVWAANEDTAPATKYQNAFLNQQQYVNRMSSDPSQTSKSSTSMIDRHQTNRPASIDEIIDYEANALINRFKAKLSGQNSDAGIGSGGQDASIVAAAPPGNSNLMSSNGDVAFNSHPSAFPNANNIIHNNTSNTATKERSSDSRSSGEQNRLTQAPLSAKLLINRHPLTSRYLQGKQWKGPVVNNMGDGFTLGPNTNANMPMGSVGTSVIGEVKVRDHDSTSTTARLLASLMASSGPRNDNVESSSSSSSARMPSGSSSRAA